MSTGIANNTASHATDGASPLAALIGPAVLPDRFSPALAMNGVRILLGLFYAPHVYQKLSGIDASLGFFAKAGLEPAPLFLGLAILCESLAFVTLVGGFFTRWTALLSAGCMVVAAYAIFATKGVNWYWAKGGVEYLVLWGLLSLAVAADAWRRTSR
ncbi:DoxX family protein [Azospirillum humicireducens]|uniref:DoxX family protein n=1 Tax=Azospirillum humicireducens TaxID=1226968 RepID=A0A160JHG8_9PROT|nr:DoxX family protein [Azospirillum humicireducens]ANC92493.1 DoxX family protein [Azospirillum humicireducens]